MAGEALLRKAQADNIVDRTVMQLRALLKEAAMDLRPFPSFPNAFFTNAIEIEGPAVSSDIGCIVVNEEGDLFEIEMGVDHDSIEMTGSWDPVTARKETLKKVSLHPLDELTYLYLGLQAVVEATLEAEEGGQ